MGKAAAPLSEPSGAQKATDKEKRGVMRMILPTEEGYKDFFGPEIPGKKNEKEAEKHQGDRRGRKPIVITKHLVQVTEKFQKYVRNKLFGDPDDPEQQQNAPMFIVKDADPESVSAALEPLMAHAPTMGVIIENAPLTEYDFSAARLLYTYIIRDVEADKDKLYDALLDRELAKKFMYEIKDIDILKLLSDAGWERPNAYSMKRFVGELSRMANVYGVVPQEHYLIRSMTYVLEADFVTGIAKIICPYIYTVILDIMRSKLIPDEETRKYLIRERRPKADIMGKCFPGHTCLVHANIANEPNQRAVELVYAIVALIETAGGGYDDSKGSSKKKGAPRKEHIAHARVSTLVERCRLLSYDMKNMKANTRSNMIKRTFKRAAELLKTHTDLFEKYADLTLPTLMYDLGMRDINKVLEFRHNGKK